ncbi:MAG: sodium:proton antiporter NhaD [Saprospiraceae bacterium]|nr:sodium:proton antiporter NhaD [Saprospiraceae bacterium]
MTAAIILCFIIGYLAIVFEHPLKVDKTVPALLMGALCWGLLAVGYVNGWLSIIDTHETVYNMSLGFEKAEESFSNSLLHHIGKISEILIFLIGAMTIVEIIDLHRGFDVLKGYVNTKSKIRLLWITGILAFFLSAIIDNLTTTIVLITLLRKLIENREERIWYASLIIIAANAGGAWSPIGDVTTTMLWIGNKVSAIGLMEYLVIPSILCFAIPYAISSFLPVFKGNVAVSIQTDEKKQKLLSSSLMLYLGLGAIIFVPVFKSLTHLPPYLGMMLSLGIVWLVSEYVHPEEDFDDERRVMYSGRHALSRIEITSILFFLGILMAVAALETLVFGMITHEGQQVQAGTLRYMAEQLDKGIPNENIVIILLGFSSAVIDNVPLVAAAMGMYNMPIDHHLWHFIAYSAGTGGSMLVIGSAAGVAAMGMERINFIWYLKKIAWLAMAGFLGGAIAFILITNATG